MLKCLAKQRKYGRRKPSIASALWPQCGSRTWRREYGEYISSGKGESLGPFLADKGVTLS